MTNALDLIQWCNEALDDSNQIASTVCINKKTSDIDIKLKRRVLLITSNYKVLITR